MTTRSGSSRATPRLWRASGWSRRISLCPEATASRRRRLISRVVSPWEAMGKLKGGSSGTSVKARRPEGSGGCLLLDRPHAHRPRRRLAGHEVASQRRPQGDLRGGDGHEVVGFGQNQRLEAEAVLDEGKG